MYKHYYIIILIVLAGLGQACSNGEGKSNNPTEESNFTNQPTAVSVQIAKSEEKNFAYKIQALGKITANQHAELSFRNAGLLQKVFVRNGQVIQKGQSIAVLDKTDWQLALRKAENDYAVKWEEYLKEVVDFGGNPELPNAGLKPELHERIKIRKGLKGASLQIEEMKQNLAYASLVSPFSGVVADLQLKEGAWVNATNPFCTIYTNSQLVLEVEVLESEVGLLQIGQKASLKALAFPDKVYEAQVSEINPKVASNGMMKVKLQILQPEQLVMGMNAQAEIVVPQRKAVVVPKSAIVIRSDKKVVFTEEGGLAKWNYVTTGLENDQEVEVLEGLTPQKNVIISNNLQLVHDSPVTVAK